ncbi:hypothetical protein ColKHC_11307 [Colletotrichum higginsianum]|nr:hypothetical protein ColKHC_11307 [Colletotrichum higginsianum]
MRERMSPAMGSLTAALLLWYCPGKKETQPCVGLRPKTEVKAAGIRRLPPPSLPIVPGRGPAATA